MRLWIEARRVAVTLGERLGQRPLGQTCGLVEHVPHSVAVEVAEFPCGQYFFELKYLEEVEFEVTHIGFVVAHRQPFAVLELSGGRFEVAGGFGSVNRHSHRLRRVTVIWPAPVR